MFEPRKHVNFDSPEAYGITPFVISHPEPSFDDVIVLGNEKTLPPIPEQPPTPGTTAPFNPTVARWTTADDLPRNNLQRSDSTASDSTVSSVDSETPMLRNACRSTVGMGRH